MTVYRVMDVPEFFRSQAGSYWHRPRSATRQTWGWSWRAWCGGTAGSDAEWTDSPPTEVCGTCDGRMVDGISDTRCDVHVWSDLTLRGGRVECLCGQLGGEAP